MARPPPRGMGAEDSSMIGGVSSQRIEMGFNPLSARLMHHEHLSRVFHGGSPGGPCSGDSARKFRPAAAPGIGDGKVYGAGREHFIQSSERDFNSGNSGMLSSIEREEGSVDREGQRILNGSPHVSSGVNTSIRVPEWAGSEKTGGMVGEEDYRDLEERGGASNESQSEASVEEEEESGDIGGEVESTGHREVSRMADHELTGQKNYESLSRTQIGSSIGGSHESVAGLQTSEGFQKANFERERIPKASTSSGPSLGMFLSPSSTIPFLSSFTSSPSEGPMLGHTEGNSTENGTTAVAGGLGTPSAYYRDGMRKEIGVSRDMFVKEGQNFLQDKGRASHSKSVHEAIPLGAVTPENENYYTSLLSSSGIPQKDAGNQIVAYGHRKSNETMEMPLRSALTDPVTGSLMDDATILSCGHSFGSDGLRRVLETNTCTTCGAAAKREDMTPNHALRSVVQAFRREQERWKENLSKSAKRRRHRQDQNRQNSGELTSLDMWRGREIQFPFKVNDRVVIQGNKRTPERFVGRDAVITAQCLNGWFVVRTLDNGESVKLQYRSLKKMGEPLSCNEPQEKITGPNWL